MLHLLYGKTTTLLNSKSKLDQRINGIAKRQTRVLEIFRFSLHYLGVESCHIYVLLISFQILSKPRQTCQRGGDSTLSASVFFLLLFFCVFFFFQFKYFTIFLEPEWAPSQ